MRAEEREFLGDDADAVVRHDHDSEQPEDPAIRKDEDQDDRGCDEQSVVSDEVQNGVQDGVHNCLRCDLLGFLGAGYPARGHDAPRGVSAL